MAITKIEVPLDGRALKGVDRLVGRGRFASRSQAIAAVLSESLRRNGRPLTAKEVLGLVRKGRTEHRNRGTRIIESSAQLR